MDAHYLPYHSNPSRPLLRLPAGAVDAHCHVFGPAERFPYAATRKYTPCDAPWQTLHKLRRWLGFERSVIVQASCHGSDNRALIDALQHAGDSARGVAVLHPEISDAALTKMHQAGVRAVRFNFLKRLVDADAIAGYRAVVARVKPLGWHFVVYFEIASLPEITPFLLSLPNTTVIDHMARPDVRQPITHPSFQALLNLLNQHEHFWVKVCCAERLSVSGPPEYQDTSLFSRTLVEQFPDRVLWGTDWPHPNMKSHIPDDGHLVDTLLTIAPDKTLLRKLLVDNPHRLYWH